eukprot:2422923-Pleurochrysis_carterae.AAC.2
MACFVLLCIPSCCHTWSSLRARIKTAAATVFRGCQLLRTTLIAPTTRRMMAMAAAMSDAALA